MGNGVNKHDTTSGVPVNPRLQYASSLPSQGLKEKNVLLDAPSLVKLQNGTVRYRFIEEEHKGDIDSRTELPHEGLEGLSKKGGYFYHPRFNDYSDYSDPSKKEDWKYCYVYKGAGRTKQKQLFYVFGKGLRTDENGILTPKYKPEGEEDDSTKFYKYHGHYYFNVDVFVEETNLDEAVEIQQEEDIVVLGDGNGDNPCNDIKILVKRGEDLLRISRRLAIKLHKPAGHFHFYKDGQEYQGDEVLHNILSVDRKKSTFCAHLHAF